MRSSRQGEHRVVVFQTELLAVTVTLICVGALIFKGRSIAVATLGNFFGGVRSGQADGDQEGRQGNGRSHRERFHVVRSDGWRDTNVKLEVTGHRAPDTVTDVLMIERKEKGRPA